MKNCILVMLMMVVLPAAGWAQEPSNEELYQMIKAMERKFDAAIEATQKAQAEADKAREEAAAARAETAKAKEELAQLKSERSAAAPSAQTTAKHLVRTSATNPGFTASVEAVYLRPSRNDLDFVMRDSDMASTQFGSGSINEIEPDYQLGARFGLGYDFGSGMEIGVRFTGLKSHDNESVTRATGEWLWGTWLHPNSIIDDNDVTSAKARYDFEHYTIDLAARQKLDLGPRLGLSLGAGLRYASMNQDLHIFYEQRITPTSRRAADISNENDFSGWGPRLDAGLDWRLGYGFNVFGSVAGSLLMGDFDLCYRELDIPAGSTNWSRRVDVKQGIRNRVIPVIETKVGVGYTYQLQNGWAFGANAGYEWQNWFNMVAAQRFSDDVDGQLMSIDTTDIGLDGFFLEAYVNF